MATTIIQGSDYVMTVSLKEKTTNKPVYVQVFTYAKLFVKKSDDTVLMVSGIQHPSDKSRLVFNISDSDTAQFKAGEGLDFDIEVQSGSNTTRKQFIALMDVFAPLS